VLASKGLNKGISPAMRYGVAHQEGESSLLAKALVRLAPV
jgi:hypothetical protein